MIIDNFKTTDLGLAATLLALGYETLDVNLDNPRKALFIFERTETMEMDIEDYWNKKVRVEPQHYYEQIKLLKSRLYHSKVVNN